MQPTERPVGWRKRMLFAGLLGAAVLAFAALGGWQVERRAWKLALIGAVESRATAPAIAAPGPGASRLTEQDDAYRHVRAGGLWLNDRATLVQAATELGAGYWVLTPLRTPAGWTVLVNRGFVPSDRAADVRSFQATDPASVTGLLRITEPKGGFLRSNDPKANRWYSRDVAAIAQARGLTDVAPYFIDADATPNPGGLPVGGLTVIAFPNSHLVYALTWFSLSGLSLAGLVRIVRPRPES